MGYLTAEFDQAKIQDVPPEKNQDRRRVLKPKSNPKLQNNHYFGGDDLKGSIKYDHLNSGIDEETIKYYTGIFIALIAIGGYLIVSLTIQSINDGAWLTPSPPSNSNFEWMPGVPSFGSNDFKEEHPVEEENLDPCSVDSIQREDLAGFLRRRREAIESSPYDAQALTCICRAIAILLEDPDSRSLGATPSLAGSSVFFDPSFQEPSLQERFIADGMAKNPSDAALQGWCNSALGNLALHDIPGFSINASRPRTLKVITASMVKHPSDPWVQQAACFSLSSLAEALVDEETLEAIETALLAFPDHPLLQEWCLTALSHSGKPQTQPHRTMAVVSAAMERHPQTESIQASGCVLLKVISATILDSAIRQASGSEDSPSLDRFLLEDFLMEEEEALLLQTSRMENAAMLQGSLKLLVGAMTQHPHSLWVHRCAVATLNELSRHPQSLRSLDPQTTVAHLQHAMARHSRDEQLQMHLLALWDALSSSSLTQSLIDVRSTVPLVTAALKAHSASESLQAQGLWTLGTLAARQRRGRSGEEWRAAVAAAEEAMEGHAAAVRIQAAGCRLLGVLASDSEVREGMGGSLQLGLVEGAMSVGEQDGQVQRYAAGLLSQLAGHPRILKSIVQGEFVALLYRAALIHDQDPLVLKWIDFALQMIDSNL